MTAKSARFGRPVVTAARRPIGSIAAMSAPGAARSPVSVDDADVSSWGDGRGAQVVAYRVAFAAGLAALAALAWWAQRDFWFVADEWDVLAHYVDGHLLTPYNGHLSAVPVAVYQALAHTVGIGSYRPYGTIGILVFLAIPVSLVCTHRRSVDRRLLAVAALGVAWSWGAETNLLYGFLINFDIPLVMLVLAWWLVRRDTVSADLWAMAALTVALASSSVGVIVAFAIGLELVLRRVPLRRLVRFAPPVIAWAIWWAVRHEATKPATLGDKVSYAWHMGVAILAGFTAGWRPGAAVVAVAIVAVLVVAHRRWRTVDAHVVATLATVAAFIALTAFSRAGDIALNPTDSPRYVFLGQFLLIAALLWCVRGRVVPTVVPIAAAAVVLVGAVPLVSHIDAHRDFVIEYQQRTRPVLAETEAAGRHADPERILPLNLIPVTVGQYLHLVDEVGSPVLELPLDALGSPSARRQADALLLQEESIALTPAPGAAGCRDAPRPVPGDGLALDAGSRHLVATTSPGPVEVTLRRFADSGDAHTIGSLGSGERGVLALPADGSTRPWTLVGGALLRVCLLD
ncbi:MAG TPA: hypothetical protein VFN21_12385 [Acidimicrobiales bacterium]|nr:hypothetical protein [Acidimicrobiales bacterium]